MTAFARAFMACACLLASGMAVQAQVFTTQARAAYVIDHNTGQVLFELNADEALPPASMSKLMTLAMAFDALAEGRLNLGTVLPVSQHCMDYGGSTMFLNTRDRVSVEDLIRGIVVLSGNDASCALGEGLSPDGTEAGFAQFMTQRARQMGMENSSFANASGWPDPGQRMSMRDLGILAEYLIGTHGQFYGYFAETEFAFDNRAPDNRFNRNPLLAMNIGADGLKTGHTEEAGYGLVGSAVQGDRRVTFVITGLDSSAARASEAERITNWAFRQFAMREVASAGVVLARADVFLGDRDSVGLVVERDVEVLLPALDGLDGITAQAQFEAPLTAPVLAGTEIGELVITGERIGELRVPLVAAQDVARGGFVARLRTAAEIVLQEVLGGSLDAG